MPVYKPSELREFLKGLGITPKKGLSQNFLIDGNIIRKIVAAADVAADDIVLEIGPGPGSLSEALLEAGASVIAVEKDRVLAHALIRFQTPSTHLEIFCQDIMHFPIQETLLQYPGKKKVIANLPYHLTTPILEKLVPMHNTFSTLVVMVQKEVAERFTAAPGCSDYGSFTVFLNFFSNPRYAFTVNKRCFYPAPKIDSAVVVFELKPPPKVSSQEQFFIMTRTAFKQRRKMLRASLRSLYVPSIITEALEKIGKNPQARPEELSLEEFLAFFELINKET